MLYLVYKLPNTGTLNTRNMWMLDSAHYCKDNAIARKATLVNAEQFKADHVMIKEG